MVVIEGHHESSPFLTEGDQLNAPRFSCSAMIFSFDTFLLTLVILFHTTSRKKKVLATNLANEAVDLDGRPVVPESPRHRLLLGRLPTLVLHGARGAEELSPVQELPSADDRLRRELKSMTVPQ